MSYRSDDERGYRHDVVTIPVLWLTIALSLLVHVGALWMLIPRLDLLSPENQERSDTPDRLEVQLTPPPSPPPSPPSSPTREAQAVIVPPVRPPRPAPRKPAPQPPVLAAPNPAVPAVQAPPPTPPVVAQPPRTYPPMVGDLSSYIEAKRRERGEAPSPQAAGTPGNAPAVPSDNGRVNDAIAANLPAPQNAMDGRDKRRGGGIFEIKRMAYDDAEFAFFGWNNDMARKTAQLIEVRKGTNSDMRIAVVRRMIVIIREHEHGDFVWESTRLGRNLTLSARPDDNASLEDFMMHEFFDDNRVR